MYRCRNVLSATLLPGALLLAARAPLKGQSWLAPLRPDAHSAQLLLLGTFHFEDAGLDAYRPRFRVDVRAPERQRQVSDLVARLARFRPTHVAVEYPRERQARLDSLYGLYRAGGLQDRASEMFQVGFRLARQLGLDRVDAVDAQPDSLFMGYFARAEKLPGGDTVDAALGARYRALYTHEDSLKTVRTLREVLRYMNSPERVRVGHGSYEVGWFKVEDASTYLGADLRAAWYDRNLRIYRNLLRLSAPDQRILLVIGAGHLPILRFLAGSSPQLRLVEADKILQ